MADEVKLSELEEISSISDDDLILISKKFGVEFRSRKIKGLNFNLGGSLLVEPPRVLCVDTQNIDFTDLDINTDLFYEMTAILDVTSAVGNVSIFVNSDFTPANYDRVRSITTGSPESYSAAANAQVSFPQVVDGNTTLHIKITRSPSNSFVTIFVDAVYETGSNPVVMNTTIVRTNATHANVTDIRIAGDVATMYKTGSIIVIKKGV